MRIYQSRLVFSTDDVANKDRDTYIYINVCIYIYSHTHTRCPLSIFLYQKMAVCAGGSAHFRSVISDALNHICFLSSFFFFVIISPAPRRAVHVEIPVKFRPFHPRSTCPLNSVAVVLQFPTFWPSAF